MAHFGGLFITLFIFTLMPKFDIVFALTIRYKIMKTPTLSHILRLHETDGLLFNRPQSPMNELLGEDSISKRLAEKWEAFVAAQEELLSAIEAAKQEVSKTPSQARTAMQKTFRPEEFSYDSVKSSPSMAIRVHTNALDLYPDCIWNSPLAQHEFSDGSTIKHQRDGFSMVYTIETK